MAEVPGCQLSGDWFDVCSCDIRCPCLGFESDLSCQPRKQIPFDWTGPDR